MNTVTTENIENNAQNVTEDNSVQEAWKRQIDKLTRTNSNSKHSFAQVTENNLQVVPETESEMNSQTLTQSLEDISGIKDPKETDTELVKTQDLIPSTNPSNLKQRGGPGPIRERGGRHTPYLHPRSEKRRSIFLDKLDQDPVQSKKSMRGSPEASAGMLMEMGPIHSPRSSLADDEASDEGTISSGNKYIDADKDITEGIDDDWSEENDQEKPWESVPGESENINID